MPSIDPTYVGQVASVAGGIVRVRLRDDLLSTLIMIRGESYRVGQIGGFFRIPLGYAQLYAVCTQIGADAAPPTEMPTLTDTILEEDTSHTLSGYRWMTVVLFGEGVAGEFERGVGQYPTVGDEVHIVTNDDLKTIYGWTGDMLIADTIVPWTCEWLIYYEIWLAIGEWYGGGEEPSKGERTDKSADSQSQFPVSHDHVAAA